MKFGKKWQMILAEMPLELSSKCISYKKWKKVCKCKCDISLKNTIKLLQKECEVVDKAITPSKNYLCWKPIEREYNKSDILAFVNINKQCLIKICKKLDKHLFSRSGILINNVVKKNKNYLFLNNAFIKRLKLEYCPECPECPECPVCYEDINKTNLGIILNCQHLVCLKCSLKIVKMNEIPGQFYNVFKYATTNLPRICKCPVCRDMHAYDNVCVDINVWPPHKKNLFLAG